MVAFTQCKRRSSLSSNDTNLSRGRSFQTTHNASLNMSIVAKYNDDNDSYTI